MQRCVGDVMSVPQAVFAEDASLADAWALMVQSGSPFVYVVDKERRLLGVLPDYELLKAKLCGEADGVSVSSVMSASVAVAHPATPVERLLTYFREARRGYVAVVRDGRLVGQLTRHDVLRAMNPPTRPRTTETLRGPQFLHRAQSRPSTAAADRPAPL